MKKHLISLLVAASALVPVASAVAADLDTLPPPPVGNLRPAAYDWSGFYVGAWAGLSCIDGRGYLMDNTTPSGPWNNGGCGVKGGGLAGYNIQMNETVFGIEADLGTTSDIVRNTSPGADFRFNMNYLGTLRGRVGWAMDDTLFYITGGGAYAQGEINGIISPTPSHLKANQFGWTLGAGIEHAVSDRVRVRMEYDYTQFADTNYSDACCNIDWHWGGEHEVKAAAIWAF